MCNDYRSRLSAAEIVEAFSEVRIPLRFEHGAPNLQPRDDIRITDRSPIVRGEGGGDAELAQLRWSWAGPGGKPVYNLRSEGRRFTAGRCLIPADGFYEFTGPEPNAPKRARKRKWLFTLAREPWFCIAGVWRATSEGDAFAMLTTAPGADVEPYHDRQIVVLGRERWGAWLGGAPEAEVLQPSPAGALRVKPVT